MKQLQPIHSKYLLIIAWILVIVLSIAAGWWHSSYKLMEKKYRLLEKSCDTVAPSTIGEK